MKPLVIAGRTISDETPPFIIAEIGNNHDGKLEQALDMISAAADIGADAVKFQTYQPDRLVRRDHELYDFFSRFALPREWHRIFQERAAERNLIFLSTPFDPDSADFLVELGVPAIKIASSDLTNLTFIRHCAAYGLPLLISSGMGSIEEIQEALSTAEDAGCKQIALLHCVSLYPAPLEKTNLLAITELRMRFDHTIGFSDHSDSIVVPVAAVALGARIIEKHFTLRRSLPGPDHAVALGQFEFETMIIGCRDVASALGDGSKKITRELKKVRKASLRGLYAAMGIGQGHLLTEEMVSLLRPAAHLTAGDLPAILGSKTTRGIEAGEPLHPDMFEEADE